VTASTMPADHAPLRVKARNRILGGNRPASEQPDRSNAVQRRSEGLYFTPHCESGFAQSAAIGRLSVPSDSLLTNDKASLSLVTNEEKRGTVTLLHTTEQAVELAEIAADARTTSLRAGPRTRPVSTAPAGRSSPPGATGTG